MLLPIHRAPIYPLSLNYMDTFSEQDVGSDQHCFWAPSPEETRCKVPACRQEGYLGGNPPTLPARGWYIVSVVVTGLMIDLSGLGIAVRRHCSSWMWPMLTLKNKAKNKIVVMDSW